jgi:hypothetical protein
VLLDDPSQGEKSFRTVYLEVDQRVGPGISVEGQLEIVSIDRDRAGFGPVSIDNGGNIPGFAYTP